MTTNTPELTILNRLVQIPLVASSLQTVHSTLQANRLTATPYATATAVSAYALGTANKYSAPIQTRLAPLVVCADGYANAAVDAVEARYPYPFHASADEVCQDLTARSEGVKGVANKTIDDRVCAPAGRIIASIDQRFTPFVDVFEACVNRISPSSSTPEFPFSSREIASSSQYQRAYALTLSLRNSLYASSSANIQQLQEQSMLVRRANKTAHSLATATQSNANTIHSRVSQLSEDLQLVTDATAQLPAHLQDILSVLTHELGGTMHDLSTIVSNKDIQRGEKLARVCAMVQGRMQPLLDATATKIFDIIGALKGQKDTDKQKVSEADVSLKVEDSRAAFAEAAEGAGIKITSLVPNDEEKETEVAAAAREHAEAAQDAGFSYADAAKGVVEEKLNSGA